MKTTGFQFTPDNLLDNIDKLGPWSSFSLAEEAILHYFPNIKRIKSTVEQINAMSKLCHEFEMYWSDWIIMYQNDVGYKGKFNTGAVNEF